MQSAIPALRALTIVSACVAAPAFAKLPPPSDEARAKAAETAAKTAWTDKVGAYQLCQAMNRTADHYRKAEKSAGKEVPPAVDTPACADPGAFVAPVTAVAAKPLEAAGAHSPTTMATSPPSSTATAAEIQGQPKK